MAITKIHAITGTIGKSIDYICNPDKTDDECLLTFNACSRQTVEYDFRFALERTNKADKNLAHHLIQSFKPGEVSSEEAHKIGEELAKAILGNKYSYVIATHNDRGHIHNHIIFCAADNIEHKKYYDTRKTYQHIRDTSDKLCKDHGLSVIPENSNRTRKSHSRTEWQAKKDGNSWKSKLKKDIDECLKFCGSYEDFLRKMKAKGYEIKNETPDSGKYISFRAPGQERWIRGRETTLGYDFTREGIIDRIAKYASTAKTSANKDVDYTLSSLNGQIMASIDISGKRFKDNEYLMDWGEKENLKALAHNYTLLIDSGYNNLAALEAEIKRLQSEASEYKSEQADIDKDIDELELTINNMQQYLELKAIYDKYRTVKNKESFFQKYEYELTLFEGARESLKESKIPLRSITEEYIEKAKEKYSKLQNRKDELDDIIDSKEPKIDELQRLKNEIRSKINLKDITKDEPAL